MSPGAVLPFPLPGGESMYCRTCRRALSIRTGAGGRVSYLHATELRGHGSDHPADPVPVSQLADPIMECDFCSAPEPVFVYRCADQHTNSRIVTATVVGRADYRDRHHAARARRTVTEPGTVQAWGERWSTCQPCADLIETRDLLGLIRRVVDTLPAKVARGNRLVRVRGELHTTFGNVLDTLTPGRGRITPQHPLGVWNANRPTTHNARPSSPSSAPVLASQRPIPASTETDHNEKGHVSAPR